MPHLRDRIVRKRTGGEHAASQAPQKRHAGLGLSVAGDTRSQGLAAPPEPTFYLAAAQFPWQSMKLLVRTDGDPLALAPAVRAALARLDPGLAPGDVTTLSRLVDANVAQPRFKALVLSVFAALALALAALGRYGLLAHSGALRTREIGVRMALGARRSTVTGLVVRQGLRLVGVGVVLGVAGSLAATRVLSFSPIRASRATYGKRTHLLRGAVPPAGRGRSKPNTDGPVPGPAYACKSLSCNHLPIRIRLARPLV
jgi:hypothetical protein